MAITEWHFAASGGTVAETQMKAPSVRFKSNSNFYSGQNWIVRWQKPPAVSASNGSSAQSTQHLVLRSRDFRTLRHSSYYEWIPHNCETGCHESGVSAYVFRGCMQLGICYSSRVLLLHCLNSSWFYNFCCSSFCQHFRIYFNYCISTRGCNYVM